MNIDYDEQRMVNEPVGTQVGFEETQLGAIRSFGVTQGSRVVPDIIIIIHHGDNPNHDDDDETDDIDYNDDLSQCGVSLRYGRYPTFQ